MICRPQMAVDPSEHAGEVEELWAGFSRDENRRVPMTFYCDEQVWLRVSRRSFREFYTVPEVQLMAQLAGQRWFCQNVVGDTAPGFPQSWVVSVRHWMEENEFFGCELIYQDDDYAWARPLPLGRDDLLHYLADIDPEERVRRNSAFKLYQALEELSAGMTFCGRPVEVAMPGHSTHGIFTKAAEIRGLQQICLDLHEAPDFVEELLRLVTEKTIGRIRAWHKITGGDESELPFAEGFHFCDDSLQLISEEMYERFVLPCHERLYSAMTTGLRSLHLCGPCCQHYSALRWKLDVTAIDGPGPFADHGHYLRRFGPEFSFCAQTDNAVLANGSEEDVDSMVRRLLTPGAKVPGRFQIVGFLTRRTPLRNVRACYRAGRKYGVIE